MQSWVLILLAYDEEIKYRRSGDHANADTLSKLTCKGDLDSQDDAAAFQISLIKELPITPSDIAEETRRDPVLWKVMDLTLAGWPAHVSDATLHLYTEKKDQLYWPRL